MDPVFRWLYPRCGEIRLQRVRIAMNEIKDAVSAGIHARDQVGPRYRTLRWNTGREQAKRSLLAQDGKVRHLALSHELFQELRIHPVNAEDDEFLVALPLLALARKQKRNRSAQQQGKTKFLESLEMQCRA